MAFDKSKPPTNDDCQELNTRYGAPGRIVFRASDSGYPVVALANKYGTAEVSLYGGNVISYRPTGNHPVVFMPVLAQFRPDSEVHGGIPICWPWFGKCGEPGSKSHGIVRHSIMRVKSSEYSEETTEITLTLKSSPETKKLWPHDFELDFRVQLSMKLNLYLTTKNTGDEPFKFTEGFHPYFKVKDRTAVSVYGVEGCEYVDARDMSKHTQCGELKADIETDHVFTLNKHEYVLMDPGLDRAIAMVSRGNSKLVVWNPGPGNTIPDLAPDDWRKFLCVEPATLFREDGIDLKPGETHELLVAIQSVPNDGSVHPRHA